ncbi:MAG: pyruvate, phosphate dikinase, partial [Chloroflexota bacterium]|nr:pyruvate, phosphate dikinase [Chloroflexota bacterium]
MTNENKWVYMFSEGSESMRNLLGGKGAGSAEMVELGLPVPPGFTITTEACLEYFRTPGNLPDELAAELTAELGKDTTGDFPRDLADRIQAALAKRQGEFAPSVAAQVQESLAAVEAEKGATFGDAQNPLLVSVRSGARASMPGMMDTVLNLGLNATTLQGVISRSGEDGERFGWDSYRRFVQGYGSIVLGLESEEFENIITANKARLGKKDDPDFSADDWKVMVDEFKALIKDKTGHDFPEEPREQLDGAIRAVFGSWFGQRAVDYRNFHSLGHDWGTAVNVQAMVFGNMGETSGTGVAFSRDSVTGEKVLYGEYLLNAQGEDVVAGVRTPEKIGTLKETMPAIYQQFLEYAEKLELHFREMQDLEFTIEEDTLWMLQTRAGKRSPRAAVKIAIDMVDEGLIDQLTALQRVEPEQVDAHLHPQVDPNTEISPIATGLNASPGAAIGIAIFDADEADRRGRNDEEVILVRPETSPDDFHGMAVAQAILTARGGATSHAAIVARALGLPAVVGSEGIKIDLEARQFTAGGVTVNEGDLITVDGTSGNVMLGETPLIPGEITPELERLLGWADEQRRLMVWANADTPEESALAREYGAQGIGLCRTEHMFREGDRLPIVQEMILAEGEKARTHSLKELLPMQRSDFYGIFKAMEGLPVIIRLLDPPLHEFLHSVNELRDELHELEAAGDTEGLARAEKMLSRAEDLYEVNPMLGLRGCRLGIMLPDVYRMQVRAIIEAAIQLKQEGVAAMPEIMIPLVGHVRELAHQKQIVLDVIEQVKKENKGK